MVKKLPSDFDIFSPSTCRKPLCIQTLAMRGVSKAQQRLRDLVLVVREDEVDAAAVDVEDLALRRIAAGEPRLEGLDEVLPRHGRALDVPAGTARRRDAGRRGPGRILRPGGFPEHEIHRRRACRAPRPRGRRTAARRGSASRRRRISGRSGRFCMAATREQHVLLGHIGRPARDQPLDDHAHLVDVLGRPGLDEARGLARLVHVLRHEHAQRPDVGVELLLGLAGHLADRLVMRPGRGNPGRRGR